MITNSMGTSLFTELKASNEPIELLGMHETTKEYTTLGLTTWPSTTWSSPTTSSFTTDTTPILLTTTTSMSSYTTTLATSSAQTTISIHTLVTTSQNISNETGRNTSNRFHLDVHVEQLVIPGHTNANHPESDHKYIDDSSKSNEKLSIDEKGVFLGWLKK